MSTHEPFTVQIQDHESYVLVVLPAMSPGGSNQTYRLATADTRPCPQMNERNRRVVRALLLAAIDQLSEPEEVKP